jgi:dihydroorotase
VSRLLLLGGRVVDPASGLDGTRDVVVEGSRVVAVAAPGLTAPDPDDRVEDVSGALVVPGLIDLHAHWYEGSPYGIDVRACLRGGVTATLDAGTAGYGNFASFRATAIDGAPVRVFALVHVAAAGLAASMVGELEDIRYARPRETAEMIRAHRDVVVGVKVRIGSGAVGTNGDAALAAAIKAAELAGTILMAHIAEGADVAAVVTRLRPGDIVTHSLTASGSGILGSDGRILPEVRAARARGVLFDVGHGCGSFSWQNARRALDDGFPPDTISTDLHRYSVVHPVVDQPTTMSKLLHLGMPLTEVIAASTTRPAAAMGHPELGALRVGGLADISVLSDAGPAELVDSNGVRQRVATHLRPTLVVADGVVHRPAEVEVRLRPFVEADHEVDCAAPL